MKKQPLFCTIIQCKGGQVTKPIIVVKNCFKLVYVNQAVKKIFDGYFLGLS